ncbi:MFS transporter [Subtercola sp. YIM 133946]|uniref:MFS transporter n=1 Tax=Subtercola sp. YIM 133946 TaxID=3118909 RepID=UPI002F92085C
MPAKPVFQKWEGHEKGSAAYRRLLAALFFAGIATFAQLYSPQAALPEISTDLGIGAASAALVVSASTVGLAIGVIPWSVLADRYGRLRSMSVAVVAASVFGLAVPFSPSVEVLLAGRFLEGMMVGGVPAIAIAYLSEEIHPGHAARAAGTYVAGTTIGGLLGRLVAGPVAELLSWRAGVFTVAVLCTVSAIVFIRLAPSPRGFVAPHLREPEASPTLRSRLWVNLRSPQQLVLYAQAFLLMGGFVALYNYLGFRLGAAPFWLPPAVVSLVFLAYLAGTWSSAKAGALASRVGRRAVLLVSIVVMMAGVALTLAPLLAVVLAGLVLATAGFFGAHSTASGWTAAAAHPTARAQASSLYNLAYYAGSSLFGWLGGVFFDAVGWSATAAMIGALALGAGLLAVVGLTPGRIERGLASGSPASGSPVSESPTSGHPAAGRPEAGA